MKKNNVFKDIVEKKIPSEILYQDKKITVFSDISPKAPVHFLVIPNKIIPSLNYIKKRDKNLIFHMLRTAIAIAKKKKIYRTGYRLIINCNKNSGQEVPHLHIHILGGKKLPSI
ncbi:HIT domain-containing protein [Buchnera aphidicola (Mindarus keteleerifoliae)]|uniref:HIT domain-containing protein n=1 Tax=Buchnera aphidicola TaxID=9 RepID=UPI0031B671B9